MEIDRYSKFSRRDKFLKELLEQISDPIHRRLIEAYAGENPVRSMESKLSEILMEVLRREA